MTNVDASCSANDKIKLEPLFPIGTKISKQFDEVMYVGSVQRHILVEKEKKSIIELNMTILILRI